jgi:hypothetical protein
MIQNKQLKQLEHPEDFPLVPPLLVYLNPVPGMLADL